MWKEIESLNGKYLINKHGKIKSKITNKVLKTQRNKFGYEILTVRLEKNKQINVRVHSLVAETYIGKRPKGYVINHKDGNKRNNYYKNLEYVTSSENNIHALKKGLRKPAKMPIREGENSPNHKITEKQAKEILYMRYKTGYGERKLEKILKISKGIISGIISEKRTRWKNINREEIKEKVRKEKENGKLC